MQARSCQVVGRSVLLCAILLIGRSVHAATFTIPDGQVEGLGGLKVALNNANINDEADTINLASGGNYVLTAGDNHTTNGDNGLPVIQNDVTGADLTIIGNGATITRSTARGTPDFRILQIGGGANVTLSGLTITNGKARAEEFPANGGGGILNDHGTLALANCKVSGNIAKGITSDNADGGGIANFGATSGKATLILNSTLVSSNSADGLGGGIFNAGSSGSAILRVEQNSTLDANSAFNGGGIFNQGTGARVTVQDSTLSSNSGNEGGGLFNNDGAAALSNCTLNSNSANGGGGLFNQDGPLTLSNCTLSDNSATSSGGIGGGIINRGQDVIATLTVNNSSFISNSAGQNGGGILNFGIPAGATATVSNSTLIGNSATFGGAVANDGAPGNTTLTVSNSTLSGNQARGADSISPGGKGGNGAGGALANRGTLTLNRCLFNGNLASGGKGGDDTGIGGDVGGKGGNGLGGAAFNDITATATLKNCTFFNNSGTGGAGGDATPALGGASPHFGGNGGAGSGGVFNQGTMTITACTLNGNTGTGGTGGTSNVNGSPGKGSGGLTHVGATADDNRVRNTISAGNNGTSGSIDVDGAFTFEGYDLIGDLGTATGFSGPGNQIGGPGNLIDPKLSPLANNGGPTRTMALVPGSPAIDKGLSFGLTTDQRGLLRPADDAAIPNAEFGDGSDIGAFEKDVVQSGPTFVVNTPDDRTDGQCSAQDCTLREAINAANTQAGANTITFHTTVFAAPGPHLINLSSALPDLSTQITMRGPGATVLTVQRSTASGTPDFRIFSISNGSTSGPTVTLNGLTIANGKASGGFPGNLGGGVNNDHGTLTVRNCVLSGNSAGFGGGIYNAGEDAGSASLTVSNCTLSGNIAGQGGGIRNGGSNGSATLSISNSTLSGNSATGTSVSFGGGIQNVGSDGSATVTIINSTLSGNSAVSGGGLANASSFSTGNADVTVRSSTLSGNSASDKGGGMYNDGAFGGNATVRLGNTILQRGATGANLFNVSGTITSLGHNLSSDDASTFLNQATDLNSTAPLLGPLQNNGGPTTTHALLPGSPAIDAANTSAPATDQRGYGRNGVPDSGAFEFDGVPPTAFRADALIKKNSEASTAFALNDVYQLTPHGQQIEQQSVTTGATAIYQVKVENDTNKSHTFGVQAGESSGSGWTIVYKKGSANITTAIKSTVGYKTGVLAPEASEIITLEMTPNTGASASKSSTLKVFLGGLDKVTRDAVRATTTVPASGNSL